ncbi:T9SS type B sorting domain-containing protein [Haloflavibacter putidus]
MGNIGQVRITVKPRPEIAQTQFAEVLCSDEPGGDTAVYDLNVYTDAILGDLDPADYTVYYYATQEDYQFGGEIEDPANYTVTNGQTVYAAVIDQATLCESAQPAEINFEINEQPVVDISDQDGIICVGDPDVTGADYSPITIATGLDPAIYNFSWSLDGSTLAGETDSSITIDPAAPGNYGPGTYTVTVTNAASGCSNSSSATLSGSSAPTFSLERLNLGFDEEHAIRVYNVEGSGSYEFRLDNGPWIAYNNEAGELLFEDVDPGEHTVYGRDTGGCGVRAQTILFIDYPDFFTPNEDGYNDTWNIIGLGPLNQGAKIFIFDRYGKLLKQVSPQGPGWDGTYNGNPLPSTDYWFRIEYVETLNDGSVVPREFKGNFTLKR